MKTFRFIFKSARKTGRKRLFFAFLFLGSSLSAFPCQAEEKEKKDKVASFDTTAKDGEMTTMRDSGNKKNEKDPVRSTTETLPEAKVDFRKALAFLVDSFKTAGRKPPGTDAGRAEAKQSLQGPPNDPFANVPEVLETLLYAEEGRKKARGEGRRMWVDRENGRIVIIDRPDRIRAVDRYLQSLRKDDRTRRHAMIRLRHVDSATAASQLSRLTRGLSNRGSAR